MKVILKGINPEENVPETQDYIKELETVPFPVECEVRNNMVNLTQYFLNTSWIEEKIWGLVWFDYEEIKD